MADFDRDNTFAATFAEADPRLLRPGVIVLANLDIDDISRLGTSLPADLTTVLDASDAEPNGPDDIAGMARLGIRPSPASGASPKSLTVSMHAADAQRVRIFEAGGVSPVIGAGKASGPQESHELTNPAYIFDFHVEALTLPGDPDFPAPTDPAPTTPDFPATLPTGVKTGSALTATRAPGEIWLELTHAVTPPLAAGLRDVALLTIAPFIMTDNTLPAECLYATYFPPSPGDPGNHDFIYDLAVAASAAFGSGVTLPSDSSTDFATHSHGSTDKLFLIDGATFPDRWAQDQLQFGYAFAPNAWMHVAAHLPRPNPLGSWVKRDLASKDIGLFESLHKRRHESISWGGNLEVSPPVPARTPAMAKGNGGPSVKAHPPAPLGKIIVGDCHPRPIHPEFHDFLVAQKTQPVLPVDTSWLTVGHADEFCSFVPSKHARGFKMIMASVRAMNKLLDALIAIKVSDGRGHFHVGRFEHGNYAEESAETIKSRFKTYNDTLRADKLIPLQVRLETGLDLASDQVIPFPTYFKVPTDSTKPYGHDDHQTVSHNVGSVNLQIVNGHLMVPRPFGPRLPKSKAKQLVGDLLKSLGLSVSVSTGPVGHFSFWASPGLSLSDLGKFFMTAGNAAQRDEVIANLHGSGSLSPSTAALATAMKNAIETHPPNTTGSNAISTVTDSAGTFTKWKRLQIPSDTLDVVEVYIRSVLEAEGNTVHFIDNWNYYHCLMGEVHCGTNVRRTPHPLDGGSTWWDHYDPSVDLDYDPTA